MLIIWIHVDFWKLIDQVQTSGIVFRKLNIQVTRFILLKALKLSSIQIHNYLHTTINMLNIHAQMLTSQFFFVISKIHTKMDLHVTTNMQVEQMSNLNDILCSHYNNCNKFNICVTEK